VTPALALTGITKRFGGREVLLGVELGVDPGEVVVLRGENGSGKSTLLAIAAGVEPADRGEVRVCGRSLATSRAHALASVGYAAERSELPETLTVGEWLSLIAALRRSSPAPFAGATLAALGVTPLLDAPLATLSLGQHRRVALAAADHDEPALLLLDEPSNGLDREGLPALHALVARARARGAGVLVATHDTPLARAIATREVTLAHGQLRRPAP
jgi:ABC-2 type transport system ATP-binding protein